MAGRLRGRVARAPEVTVVTVGDAAVGKTALIQRFCNDTFPQVTLSTNTHYYVSPTFRIWTKRHMQHKLTETSKRFGKYAFEHFLQSTLLLDPIFYCTAQCAVC